MKKIIITIIALTFGVVAFGILYSFLFKEPKKFQESNIALQRKLLCKLMN